MKRILITGATGGIGKPLSLHLTKKGYELVLLARNPERLNLLKTEVASVSKISPMVVSIDLSNRTQIESFDYSTLGQLDGFVLMPPQLDPTPDPFATMGGWDQYFNASFIGPLSFFKAILPNLKQSDRAKVVIISGISSLQVLSHYATSNVLRCAWVGQAKTLAHYLGQFSIHVNTLSLGGILTEEYMSELNDEAKSTNLSVEAILKRETSNVPLQKYGNPTEVATAVEGLLSDFSNHITGVNIALDGGFTKAY